MTNAVLEWGVDGALAAVNRGDVILVIDVLRFTSAAITAISKGFTVIPAKTESDAYSLAKQFNVRFDRKGLAALSPESFINENPSFIVLTSPHGATLSCTVADAENAFLASFLNATAAAQKALGAAKRTGKNISIVASGEIGAERRGIMPDFENKIDLDNEIFCFEDYACAGYIGTLLQIKKSDELLNAGNVFALYKPTLSDALLQCASGKYLVDNGMERDVRFCSQLNVFSVVPAIHKEKNGVILRRDNIGE